MHGARSAKCRAGACAGAGPRGGEVRALAESIADHSRLPEPGSVSESGVGSRPAHPAGPQVNAARTPRGPRRRGGHSSSRGRTSLFAPGARMARRDRLAVSVTWLAALLVLGLLAGLVVRRQGNLAWDDADYLRRGLTNVRLAESAGVWWVVPRALGRVYLEQPKPPWLVAWIELGALVFSRPPGEASCTKAFLMHSC